MYRSIPPRGVLAVGLLVACASAQAQDEPGLAGDWGGLKPRLARLGITPELGYVGEFAQNTAGGERETSRYADQTALGAHVDLETLFGLPTAELQVTLSYRDGENLSDEAGLGTLQQVQEIHGRGQDWRLSEFWFQQAYMDGRLKWKIGRLAIGEDFAAYDCDFQNLTFCTAQPGNIVGDYWFNFPVSVWATRVEVALREAWTLALGLYDSNPGYLEAENRVALGSPEGPAGWLIPLELRFSPSFGTQALEGTWRIGGWYDTSHDEDVLLGPDGAPRLDADGPALEREGRYGVWIGIEQRLLAFGDGRGLRAFVRGARADDRTATTDRQLYAGVVVAGPLAFRPDDEIALAVGRTWVNGRVARRQRLARAAGRDVEVQDAETVVELQYGLHVTDGLTLRPNLQWVREPGGVEDAATVRVIGLKTQLAF
ncbi:carbohydrate porin [Coralloluteibacterium stylophorae]|uniref:Carbohydrate porin n=3 Tax=Coralloluteibacterium stylophorae TaxID=1776034 RepID=A0AAP2CAW7_9GAMM|nr:carbohydrate porin [Coralloluteibacterium stylophorae]MBS7457508.1 carbohydrate porin [Coralloluteibacterium stylophorae]